MQEQDQDEQQLDSVRSSIPDFRKRRRNYDYDNDENKDDYCASPSVSVSPLGKKIKHSDNSCE